MAALADRPPGTVRTLVADGGLVITLAGEIDLCLRPELTTLARTAARFDGRRVVDVTGVTFCDGTLAGFLAEARGQEPVGVRGPSRLVRDLLEVSGLWSASCVVVE